MFTQITGCMLDKEYPVNWLACWTKITQYTIGMLDEYTQITSWYAGRGLPRKLVDMWDKDYPDNLLVCWTRITKKTSWHSKYNYVCWVKVA